MVKVFFSKAVNKEGMPNLTTPIQHCVGNPWLCNNTRKSNKRHTFGKEAIKNFLFTDNMIIYIEKPKKSTKIVVRNVKWA